MKILEGVYFIYTLKMIISIIENYSFNKMQNIIHLSDNGIRTKISQMDANP
jgi:hypothetical protein